MKVKDLLYKLSWLSLIPFMGIFYTVLNNSHGTVYSLVTNFDRVTPLVPSFVLPYICWYPFLLLSLIWLLRTDRKLYIITLGSLFLGVLICFTVYSVFQTTVPRPSIIGQDIYSQLLRLVYKSDEPYNAFPSIHVLTSFILLWANFQTQVYSKVLSFCSQLMAVLIICSTVLLKQHVIFDLLAGIVLGWISFRIVGLMYNLFKIRKVKVWPENPSLLSTTNTK